MSRLIISLWLITTQQYDNKCQRNIKLACVTKKVIQIYTRQKKKIKEKLTVNKKYHTQLYMLNKYNM